MSIKKKRSRRWVVVVVVVVVCAAAVVVGGVIRDRSGAVALVRASSAGDVGEIDRLVGSGVAASASYTTIEGIGAGEPSVVRHVPLIAAARRGEMGAVVALLRAGAAIDAVNESGETALMVACRADVYEVVEELVARGADVNMRCERGRTALHWAAGYASPRVVELLMSKRARGGADRLGWSPLDVASNRADADREAVIEVVRRGWP